MTQLANGEEVIPFEVSPILGGTCLLGILSCVGLLGSRTHRQGRAASRQLLVTEGLTPFQGAASLLGTYHHLHPCSARTSASEGSRLS